MVSLSRRPTNSTLEPFKMMMPPWLRVNVSSSEKSVEFDTTMPVPLDPSMRLPREYKTDGKPPFNVSSLSVAVRLLSLFKKLLSSTWQTDPAWQRSAAPPSLLVNRVRMTRTNEPSNLAPAAFGWLNTSLSCNVTHPELTSTPCAPLSWIDNLRRVRFVPPSRART